MKNTELRKLAIEMKEILPSLHMDHHYDGASVTDLRGEDGNEADMKKISAYLKEAGYKKVRMAGGTIKSIRFEDKES